MNGFAGMRAEGAALKNPDGQKNMQAAEIVALIAVHIDQSAALIDRIDCDGESPTIPTELTA